MNTSTVAVIEDLRKVGRRRSKLAFLLLALTQCDPRPADSPTVSSKDGVPVVEPQDANMLKESAEPEKPAVDTKTPDAPETTPTPTPTEPEDERPPLEATSSIVSGVQPPVKKLSEAQCSELEEVAQRELELLEKPCNSVADCELVDTVCPFDCHLVLSRKTKRDKAKKAVERYFEGCLPCKAKCALPPSELACVEGRCVELPVGE